MGPSLSRLLIVGSRQVGDTLTQGVRTSLLHLSCGLNIGEHVFMFTVLPTRHELDHTKETPLQMVLRLTSREGRLQIHSLPPQSPRRPQFWC